MPAIYLSAEQFDAIRHLRAQGVSWGALTEQLGFGRHLQDAVRFAYRRHVGKASEQPKPPTELQLAQAERDGYKSGPLLPFSRLSWLPLIEHTLCIADDMAKLAIGPQPRLGAP